MCRSRLCADVVQQRSVHRTPYLPFSPTHFRDCQLSSRFILAFPEQSAAVVRRGLALVLGVVPSSSAPLLAARVLQSIAHQRTHAEVLHPIQNPDTNILGCVNEKSVIFVGCIYYPYPNSQLPGF